MSNQIGLLLILIVWFVSSCSTNTKNPSSVQKDSVPEPDSSAFYDSLSLHFVPGIKNYFEQKAKATHFNGTYLFAHGGYVIDSGYYGYARYSEKDSLTFNSSFQLASGSKPFTATAILMLVESGKINLQDSIHHLLPDLPYSGITVEMLLCHRGGLGNYIYFTEYIMKDSSGDLTNEGILDILQDTVPDIYYPPDRKFDYSNTGYALLALIVERISGDSFGQWMKANLFEPFGMTNSFIIRNSNQLPTNAAIGHLWDYRLPGNGYLNGVVGDKGMYASASDLLAFDRAYTNGEIISDSLMRIATQAHNPLTSNGKNYGFGWRLLYPDTDKKIVFHTGWWQGCRTYFISYPKEDKTIVVLDNIKRGAFLGIEELVGLFSDDY